MRSVFVLFLLVFYFSGFGQIINFSDPDFKDALVNTKCVDTDGDGFGDVDADVNNDGEIEMNEVLIVKFLVVSDMQISSLEGIKNFNNLQKLKCENNLIKTLNIQGLTKMTELICNNNQIEAIDIQGITFLSKLECSENNLDTLILKDTRLKFLDCKNNNLVRLNLENMSSLLSINCDNNNLDTLELNNLPNLRALYARFNNITSFNPNQFKSLYELNLGNNKITSIIINELYNLEFFHINSNNLINFQINTSQNLKHLNLSNNNLEQLKISNMSNLEWFSCSNNKIKQLDISKMPTLKSLSCNSNEILNLHIKDFPQLEFFECMMNNMISLILEDLPNLNSMYCNDNKLEELIFKTTHNIIPLEWYFFKNPTLKYICCREELINDMRALANSFNLKNVEINSYCSFSPFTESFGFRGKNFFNPTNADCYSSNLSIPYLKYSIVSQSSVKNFIYSNKDGNFNVSLPIGKYTVTPIVEAQNSFNLTPSNYQLNGFSITDTITQNFCITPKEPYRQIDITIIPLTPPARPGFDAKYKIIWENKGNLLENGTIHFTYDENIFDYVSADQTPDAINNGKLSWDYTDILPFEKREIIVTLNLNSPMENPPVNAGDITYLYANILDNIFRLENVIVGSYDPNDKTCLQGQYFHPDSVGKYVDFLIRFENTGNYAAQNVVIKDIIDDKTFDVSSLLITDASHEVYTRIAANKVEFIFENIQLPFEDETSDGYVAFKIKTKSTLKLGDEMKNLADIYFDYNFPIRTNETQTTIAIPTSTKDFNAEVTIHPNPVRDVLTLDSSTRWNKAEIFDISGRLIKVTGVDGYSVDVCGLDSGTYILHLSDKDKRGRVKFVKM